MSYSIAIERAAEKFLHKADKDLQNKLFNRIFGLRANPRPVGSKKLLNSNNYRVRMGNYRIVY